METSTVSNGLASKEDFLLLFTTQLKNQTPLDPLKGHEFIAQLAQFSSVEQLANLNASFSEIFRLQQLLGSGELIGKQATYIDSDGELSEGVIQGATTNDETTLIVINNKEIPISNLTGIFENK